MDELNKLKVVYRLLIEYFVGFNGFMQFIYKAVKMLGIKSENKKANILNLKLE